jgi:D-alanyl-lipoteichoic acid acyltransferase DltB (MBOAT superfamily)
VAGPINKASLMIPQLKALRTYFDYGKAVDGLKMLLWGMFVKVVVADRAAIYVDTIFPFYNSYSGLTCLQASFLYTIQIYADFAGYSLMAIGVGKVLGFELAENFRRPYFAVSVTDFWRRWHISLSIWLRDYVYIPLGGSRCLKMRNYFNIFVTFLISGIWHGANWTFIIWGIWHGVAQIVEKMVGQQECDYGTMGRVIKIIITFLIINFAWVFFRMPTVSDAIAMMVRMFDFSLPLTAFLDYKQNLPFMLMGITLLFAKDVRDEFFPRKFLLMNSNRVVVRWITYIFLMSMILLTGVFGDDQFIYAAF